MDCHFIIEKDLAGCIVTCISYNEQLANIFSKSLRAPQVDFICNKLGAYNLC